MTKALMAIVHDGAGAAEAAMLLQSKEFMSLARVGVIGGGLMGREVASAFGRWFVLNSYPVRAELVAVCDLVEKQREWFRQVPTVRLITSDHHELLASAEVDVVYVAVPHNLHETIYLDVLKAGKDLLAEKPFGIDLEAARTIAATAQSSGRFRSLQLRVSLFSGSATRLSRGQGGGSG